MNYRDEAKERATTHWDLDYMTRAKLDAVTAEGTDRLNTPPTPRPLGGVLEIVMRWLAFGQAEAK